MGVFTVKRRSEMWKGKWNRSNWGGFIKVPLRGGRHVAWRYVSHSGPYGLIPNNFILAWQPWPPRPIYWPLHSIFFHVWTSHSASLAGYCWLIVVSSSPSLSVKGIFRFQISVFRNLNQISDFRHHSEPDFRFCLLLISVGLLFRRG